MIRSISFIFLFISTVTFGQIKPNIFVIDFVKVKNEKYKEALFFYENNWKYFRDIAARKNYISSYSLLTTKPDSTANFDIMLITGYEDSTQFNLGEERFQQIIKEFGSNGPNLLNELKPNDFRITLFSKQTQTLFGSDK